MTAEEFKKYLEKRRDRLFNFHKYPSASTPNRGVLIPPTTNIRMVRRDQGGKKNAGW
jgi:hypothetical protein